MNNWKKFAAASAAVALIGSGCASPETPEDEEPVEEPAVEQQQEPVEQAGEQPGVMGLIAIADMQSGDQQDIGEVEFTQTDEGVEVQGRIEHEELAGGLRGFHVHEFGECDPPDFESAGAHFNHTETEHGSPDDPHGQRHAGDFGNLEFDEDGVAEFSFVDDVIALGEGDNDIVGKALIVHYEEDDLETQPTGDAGARAGCGLIETVREDVR